MNVYGIMYLSLWCSSPQDECMFNTLPYYITDLFIIAYIYPKVSESVSDTTRYCKKWGPLCALLMQYFHKPSNLIHIKMPLLAVFSQLKHYSLDSTSAVPGNKIQTWQPSSGPIFHFLSITVGWTTESWTAGP